MSVEGPPEPLEVGEAGTTAEASTHRAGLFGRGLLYVIVFSLQTVAATVVSPILAHLVGAEEFGRLASSISLYQLLTVFAVLGLDQAILLQKAEDKGNAAARGLVCVAFATAAGVTLLAAGTARWWVGPLGFGTFTPLLVATLLWTVAGACVQVMLSLLLAEDRLKVFTLVSAFAAVGGQVFGIALLVIGDNTATTYAWGGVISQFAAMVIGIAVTRPRLRGLSRLIVSRAYRLGLPLTIGGMATFILNAGDRLVIQRLLGASEVGRYQIAYTVGYVVVLLLTFVSQSWTPRFAAIHEMGERRQLAGVSRDEILRLLVPVILGITLGAPVALRIVAPASYQPDSLVIVVFLVALSAFPVAASGAVTRELMAMRRGRSIAAGTAAAAVLNVALNLLLVPIMGIAGSAAATAVSFALQAVLQRLLLGSAHPWPAISRRLWLVIAAACTLAALSTLLPQTTEWNLARLAVAVGCIPWLVIRLMAARTGQLPAWAARIRPRRAQRTEG